MLTVLVADDIYSPHTDEEVENRRRFWERALTEEGADHYHFEVEPIVGREAMLFIGPAVGTSVEVWRVFHNWNIEQRDDGTVVAVHPHSRYFSAEKQQKHRSILELELPAFKKAVVAAQEARIAANDGRVCLKMFSPSTAPASCLTPSSSPTCMTCPSSSGRLGLTTTLTGRPFSRRRCGEGKEWGIGLGQDLRVGPRLPLDSRPVSSTGQALRGNDGEWVGGIDDGWGGDDGGGVRVAVVVWYNDGERG